MFSWTHQPFSAALVHLVMWCVNQQCPIRCHQGFYYMPASNATLGNTQIAQLKPFLPCSETKCPFFSDSCKGVRLVGLSRQDILLCTGQSRILPSSFVVQMGIGAMAEAKIHFSGHTESTFWHNLVIRALLSSGTSINFGRGIGSVRLYKVTLKWMRWTTFSKADFSVEI